MDDARTAIARTAPAHPSISTTSSRVSSASASCRCSRICRCEEKVRRGNVLLKTRPRDVEETLLQLINDDDQVVAATAIEVVREQQLWALGDDVEHVLALRDPQDWYVFESASWALAERRMPASRRRELWLEPLPAVGDRGPDSHASALRVDQRRRAVPDCERIASGAA